MEFDKAEKRVHANTANHLKMIKTLYDIPGFPADEITDYYADTLDDIFTPGHKQGIEKLTELSTLAEKMNEATPYIAMVRTKFISQVSYGNAIAFPKRYLLDSAWVRVFKDLTPDKLKVITDSAQTVVGGESGVEMFKSVVIDHPSELFELGHEASYDETAMLDTTQSRVRSMWDPITREVDVPATFIYADSIQQLTDQLTRYEATHRLPGQGFGAFADDITTALLFEEIRNNP